MGKLDQLISQHGLVPILKMPRLVTQPLIGPAPVNRRGDALDYQTHLFLNVADVVQKQEVWELELTKGREVYRDASIAMSPAGPKVRHISQVRIPTRDGEIEGRLYKPAGGDALPVIMFMHGGGFCIGDVEGYDPLAKYIAQSTGCAVLSLDYRLAPEHKFPNQIHDCIDAFNWLLEKAELLGLDPERIAVSGDSAGGKLSLLVTQNQIVAELPKPSMIFSLYPLTWHGHMTESRKEFAQGFFLTGSTIDWFSDSYLGNHSENDDPRVSPIGFNRLGEMPPIYLTTAGFDPLRDEGEEYVQKVRAAGGDVTHRQFDHLVHGYITMGGAIEAAQKATEDYIAAIRAWAW